MVDQTVTGIEEEIGLAAIKVVGVGGGGSNAVSRMYRERIPEVEYITVNTVENVMRKIVMKENRHWMVLTSCSSLLEWVEAQAQAVHQLSLK